MPFYHRRRATMAVLLATLLSPLITVADEAFPRKPVTIIVPSPAGGSSDVITRVIAERLTARFGKPFLVENRAGAGGFIGMQAAARAEPDGHTLILGSLTYQVLNPALYKDKLPYNPDRDFVPIALLAKVPYIFVAAPDFPPNNLKEVVEFAKKNPGKFNYSIPGGSGNTAHIGAELFKKVAGIDLVGIPYKGDAQGLTAVMGNQVQVQFTTPLGSLPFIKSGRMKVLAAATHDRLSIFPDVSTFAEQGYPEIEVSTWFSFLAPAATPKAVVQLLNAEINKILGTPGVRKRIEELGSIPAGGSLESIQEFMKLEASRWNKRVEISGAKIEN